MEQSIRDAQIKILNTFAGATKTFALAGGTALELFYLKHRFSRDLDFFSPEYKDQEIDSLARTFSETLHAPISLESKLVAANRAKVRFYTIKIKGAAAPLKIDFIEDVFFKKPTIAKFAGIPVYSAGNIYFQKIVALTGSFLLKDEIGRELPAGRKEVRDVVDIYYLSKKIKPLHKFVKTLDKQYQRGVVQWYRGYSRQDVKLGVLDLNLYDGDFDASEMINHFDAEIKLFMGEAIK